ncbi:MAG: hypothetical protein CM15mP101_07030 [Flavobacteriaceae bacterium]|nr:MAG: hypothetical protein CM15mP101_07030 [Flavobacteriaceae bacterium]
MFVFFSSTSEGLKSMCIVFSINSFFNSRVDLVHKFRPNGSNCFPLKFIFFPPFNSKNAFFIVYFGVSTKSLFIGKGISLLSPRLTFIVLIMNPSSRDYFMSISSMHHIIVISFVYSLLGNGASVKLSQ